MESVAAVENEMTYRTYQPGDEEAIMRLWEEESGWGALSKEQFRTWFRETPNGEAIIIVAEREDKKILGQIVFTPTRAVVGGQVMRSLRGAAPILDSSLRQSSIRTLNHPAFELMRKGVEVAKEKGYQLTYGFPSFGWIAMLRLLPQLLPYPSEAIAVNCFAVDLSASTTYPKANEKYHAMEISRFSKEHESLWNEMVRNYPIQCAVQRDANWLQWSTGSQLKLEIRSKTDSNMIGYASIKRASGLITDIVAKTTTDLQLTYQCMVEALHTGNPSRIEVSFDKLKGMATPEAEKALDGIPYEIDSYRFAFSYMVLDETLDPLKIHSSMWYLTPLG